MALADNLNGKTVQNLIDDNTFITALVPKLTAGAGDNGIYTKTAADTALTLKAAIADIYTKNDADGKFATIAALAAKANTADVYTKTAADTAFVKTADLGTKDVVEAIFDAKDGNDKISETKIGATFAKKTDLDNKANIDGTNLDDAKVTVILDKLTDKVVKTSELSAKVAEKAVVDAITVSSDFTGKVYTKTAADTAFVKTADLGTKDVVEAIFDAKDGNDKISETKIGATFAKKTDLDNKANIDGTNLDDAKVTVILDKLTDKVVKTSELSAKVAEKAVVNAIFDAKDGNKSILVNKLEGFLAENTKVYSNNTKTAKELLVPSAADLVQNHDFKQGIDKSIKEMAVSSNSDFQKNVREVMSQPSFEIPTSDDAALNWTW